MKIINRKDIEGKNVIIRCDLNVPIKDGIILDDYRIKQSLKTIKYALEYSNRVILLSHLGRVKTLEDRNNNSLRPVCDYLSNMLNEKIDFYDYQCEFKSNNKIIMFENTRFFDLDDKKESNCDNNLSKYFASFGDVFIDDAFGVSHRANASNVGIKKYLKSLYGFLFENEIKNLDIVKNNPKKPFTVIMGGAKVSDKIGLINKLISKVDNLIVVGAMAFTFIKSEGNEVGKSFVDEDSIEFSRELLNKYSNKILLPIDFYTSKKVENGEKKLRLIKEIENDEYGLDIGPASIKLINDIVQKSNTIFLNGPAGKFELEDFSYGTKALLDLLSKSSAIVIVGGGDSASAAINFGYINSFTHISTGGGASLEYIEGKTLPALKDGDLM